MSADPSPTVAGSQSLGRSLATVLAGAVRKDPPKGYLEVDAGMVAPSPDNPRTVFDEGALRELAENIRVHGILQPIVVTRAEGGGWRIVSGERRWRAARIAGLQRVPVVVREDADPRELDALRIIENVQRQDLGPLELARAYQRLIDQHGLTHEQVATAVGKERASVSNHLRLLTLPPPIATAVDAGKLTMGHARALLAAADPLWQQRLAQRIADEGLSVREVERLAKLGPPAAPPPGGTTKPAHLRELESNLKHLFGSPVSIREKRDGSGTVTINFEDKDQFQRLVAIMNKFVNQANLDALKRP